MYLILLNQFFCVHENVCKIKLLAIYAKDATFVNNTFVNIYYFCITYSTVYLYVVSWYTTLLPQIMVKRCVKDD